MEQIRTFVEYVIDSLIDEKTKRESQHVETEKALVLEVKLAKDDIGKVIGRSGRTADALRSVMAAGAAAQDKRYHLQILDLE